MGCCGGSGKKRVAKSSVPKVTTVIKKLSVVKIQAAKPSGGRKVRSARSSPRS